jgi:organic radical activating enzyme
MIKTRCFPEKNYKSIYFNGKTMRIALDPEKPIRDLDYPEFYDIKLTDNCNGNCSYCYQNSGGGNEDVDAVRKLTTFFMSMSVNERPFQIAYGGGEPTMHPQFHEIMKLTRNFDVSPNYTTNGMFIESGSKTREITKTTKEYCEGVAITCHKHLKRYWHSCADYFIWEGIFTNFHNLINDEKSVDDFFDIYEEWKGKIKYFVVLPLINQGRAKDYPFEHEYFFDRIEELINSGVDISDIAFGANFFPYLEDKKYLKLSLYEPEIMSKYLDLTTGNLYKSSFDTGEPIKKIDL